MSLNEFGVSRRDNFLGRNFSTSLNKFDGVSHFCTYVCVAKLKNWLIFWSSLIGIWKWFDWQIGFNKDNNLLMFKFGLDVLSKADFTRFFYDIKINAVTLYCNLCSDIVNIWRFVWKFLSNEYRSNSKGKIQKQSFKARNAFFFFFNFQLKKICFSYIYRIQSKNENIYIFF